MSSQVYDINCTLFKPKKINELSSDEVKRLVDLYLSTLSVDKQKEVIEQYNFGKEGCYLVKSIVFMVVFDFILAALGDCLSAIVPVDILAPVLLISFTCLGFLSVYGGIYLNTISVTNSRNEILSKAQEIENKAIPLSVL